MTWLEKKKKKLRRVCLDLCQKSL